MTYYEHLGLIAAYLLSCIFCFFVGDITGLFLWGVFTGGMLGYEAGRRDA